MRVLQSLRKRYYRTLGYASQWGQDRFVVDRLGRLRGGVFFDIGAFDGVQSSNTYYLETRLGWSGIAVEPSAAAFEKLRQQRHCTVVNGCIGPAASRVKFLEIEGYAAMLSGRLDRYHPQHRERIDREIAERGGAKREVERPCFTIEQLAREHHIERIDYLSLDTEGGELAILQSINFAAIDIRLITVENNYADPAFRSFLEESGFEYITQIGCDEVYEQRKYL